MGWRGKIIIILIVVLSTISPATTKIYQYTDNSGVLKITNISPEHRQDPPVTSPPLPITPISTAFTPAHPQDRKADYVQQSSISRFVDKQGVIHISNHPTTTTMVAAAPPAPYPPISTALASSEEPGRGAPRETTAGSCIDKSAAPAGKIRLYQNERMTLKSEEAWLAMTGKMAGSEALRQVVAMVDKRGILKITNLMPFQPLPGSPPDGVPLAVLKALQPIIQEAAAGHRLPPALIQAVIQVESNFFSQAVSPKGAQGLMQLMPSTASSLGVQNPFCPRENIMGGCRYLREMLDSCHESLPLALAAYNAGLQRVINAGFQVPAIKETQEFVTKVLSKFFFYQKQEGSKWRI